MSQENVEIVKRAWEAWSSGDVDAVLATCDPAVEWDLTRFEGWPEDDVYYGHEGFRRFLEEWRASWERFEARAEHYVDGEDDRVVVLCWQRGFGAGSQVPVKMDLATTFTLERGLICRIEAYSDRQEPSKPWGCGSRRCRRRTWKSRARVA
jgi:ketosteroid isomerase-like protein